MPRMHKEIKMISRKKTAQLKWAWKKKEFLEKMQMADEHLSKCLQ